MDQRARDVVVVDAVRTPFGRRKGVLAGVHSSELFGAALTGLLSRVDLPPTEVGQLVGGCVGQVGMQSANVSRTAWLTAGLPEAVPATTVDAQCGSAQQAVTLAHALVGSGLIDVAVAGGVENMSRVPMGATVPKDPDVGRSVNRAYWAHREFTSQFDAAERLATKWGITRAECDELGLLSQQRAAAAWAAEYFDTQIVPVVTAPAEGTSDAPASVTRDECLRESSLSGLAGLKTNMDGGVHTAGTSSQIADGASALLMMTRRRASELGLEVLATLVDSCLVGCDPVLMLEGPIVATHRLLAGNGLTVDDLDLIEINEAFASVVLAWTAEFKVDPGRVNPNGGAIAYGHPLGATGAALITKAVHELIRTDQETALVTMCCGGGLGTGTLIRRG